MSSAKRNVHALTPPFRKSRRAWEHFVGMLQSLRSVDPASADADPVIEQIRREASEVEVPAEHQTALSVVISVLCDLRLQGWTFTLNRKTVELQRPTSHLDPSLERDRIRRMHAVNRNAQLIKGSVRTFVRSLERKRLGPDGWVSIFSLMRDGRELAEKLRELEGYETVEEKHAALRGIIKPYLQFVSDGNECEHTGLPLGEIWRYFRHTWTTEYNTVPGRNVMILVRDAAADHHPVIGIAALASPVVHLGIRDEWIGWAPQQFVNELRSEPTAAWAKWVIEQLDRLIAEIYVADLISDGILARAEIKRPKEATIASLEEESARARERHRLHPQRNLHKNPAGELAEEQWIERAQTDLFRSKRCSALAELLRAKLRLKDVGFEKPTKEALEQALSTSEGRLAVETIRKQVKAIHIGNDVLDICVCGAIAPYSELLGGKLVSLLLTSPEVARMYSHRYGQAPSIIASSMAGRRVTRRPRLVALTTTSLYGAEPNQYTRLRVPVDPDDEYAVRFQKLGRTRGQGSYHFSGSTVDAIEILISQMSDGRSVNSIFGEGVNPRMRKIRTGLDACGFPTDEVLTHGTARVVYGISLVDNLCDVLMGRAKRAKYILDQRQAVDTTNAIAELWRCRWLLPRVDRDEIIDRIEQHTLVAPVEHGARVPLPRIFDEEPLFFHLEQE